MNCFSRTAIMRVIEDSDKYDFIHSKYIEIRQLSHKKSQLIKKNFEKRDGYEINKVFVDRKLVIKIMISFITVLIVCLCLKSFNNDTNLSYEIQLPSEYSLLPRENIKKKIEHIFKQHNLLSFVVLVGEAGIGKTTIARKYIKDHNFSIKAEIDAESEFKLIESFEDLIFLLLKNDEQLKSLKFIKSINSPEEKRKKLTILIKELLKGYKNWCIIYDNAENLDLLRSWLPLDNILFKNDNIIITTKNKNIENLVFPYQLNIINISYLTTKESRRLLYCIVNG